MWRRLGAAALVLAAVAAALFWVLTAPQPLAAAVADIRPNFAWSGVTGAAHYQVQVDDVSAGRVNIFPGATTTATSWEVPADLVSGRTYTWQVRAVNAQGLGAWSPAATVAISRPTLTGPVGTAGSLRPTFTWTGVGGAGSYEVRVDNATTGRVRLFTATVGSLSWVPPTDLTAGHTYRWYVRALNADGLGVWSPAGTFRVG